MHNYVDAYLISFPKCGRTWLRLMIGTALQQQFDLSHPDIKQKMLSLTPLAELHPNIPTILIDHDDNPQWNKPEELQTSKDRYKNVKVIFLVRDPRDVVVSAYFEQKKRVYLWADGFKQDKSLKKYLDRIKPYEGNLSEFIYEDVGSLKTLLRYYNIWKKNRHIPKDFLLVRYEDIHENPHQELRIVLDFLGVQYRDEVINEAVNYSSFEKMRNMEKTQKFDLKLKPANLEDEESYKTRKGKVGGFAEYLNEKEIAYINHLINDTLSDFYGYKA
ncbi:sulfotransferase domain-containing protein [Moorena sp. SIO3I6]|uniref:sulfotransferase domain-containing protein n=1 Tax=Moorena sp. SIO3I6 TaxID=2607831 RepID=UPI0013F84741|nr:sulfotransferase domain-containing protein [Moorena sp. SIO3I6]NEP21579.1 sulfotransferase domain-containing protein [Moorena sp. SIO3I6]